MYLYIFFSFSFFSNSRGPVQSSFLRRSSEYIIWERLYKKTKKKKRGGCFLLCTLDFYFYFFFPNAIDGQKVCVAIIIQAGRRLFSLLDLLTEEFPFGVFLLSFFFCVIFMVSVSAFFVFCPTTKTFHKNCRLDKSNRKRLTKCHTHRVQKR